MTTFEGDHAMMRAALGLARRGLGNVWPNPAVGCVIAKDGRVVGRGWTGKGGRPHAETEALRRAGEAARGATAYASLEPCCHWGKTPPCADALAAAGVKRVVAALADPDPRVAGGGLARLREAGISVETGLLAEEAAEINAGFLTRLAQGRPLVTLKLATSLDGRIATHSGESRWITGPAARERAHLLRSEHDAVMVGTGTVLADDPLLTCRLPGLAHRSPVRVVLDRRLRIPLSARIFAEARALPTWVLTATAADPVRRQALAAAGATPIEIDPAGEEGLDLAAGLAALGSRGLTRLLVEGGARLAATLLRARLVDRLLWFHAPKVLGGDGIPAAAALGIAALAEVPRFERTGVETVGEDVLTSCRVRY
ncbi:MAG TPA: bifunctional diaminohydroxyphosphoribosylaminopyrimidine deaminase/5-amino-6-(5-phosphoribosylamino)uracil reductase RibD [Stellaceae bacterium]|nr:bifunctional diaminohydroxyphosphoribosylaminopyrimidine deaminase/5-amino-6-(5-phosphoribosylamino)uracil reductase RibD [Stellaceae bacterium]